MPDLQRATGSKVSPSLTSPEDWLREGYGLPLVGPKADFQGLLDKHLPKRKDWSVLEIGACPGSQLLAVALSHGYRPAALDYLPAVRKMPERFAHFGVPDLEVIEADFLDFATDRRFNVVMSFGFIEHFTDPHDIIRRHWDLVAEGGYLVLGSPSFGPLQRAFRRLVQTPEERARASRTHNPEIMDLRAIAEFCRRLPGATLRVASSAGQMATWISPRGKDVRKGMVWLVLLWHAGALLPKALHWSSRAFSPLCLVIVQRA